MTTPPKPNLRPKNPRFSSGPCTKHPDWSFAGLKGALLGRNHPVGVILAALLFAVLQHGGIYVDGFSEHVTKDIVQVLQGIIILFVAAESFFKYMSSRLGLNRSAKV